MFGVGGVELVVAGVLVAAALLVGRYLGGGQWVPADRATPVGLDPVALEMPLGRLLDALPATRVVAGGPGTWTVLVERAQLWTFVPAVLLFPFGVLFLLFREHGSLVVSVREVEGATEVRVLGTTRLSVRETLERAIADLPVRPAPDAADRS